VVLDYADSNANGRGRDPVSTSCRVSARHLVFPLCIPLFCLLAVACSGPVAEPAAADVEAQAYPNLATVPPHPVLDNTIEQRADLGKALASELAWAQYRATVTREDVGLEQGTRPQTPPPALPEPQPVAGGVPVVPPPGPPGRLIPGGGEIAELSVEQQVLTERNNGRLESFLRILERQQALDRRIEEAGLGQLPDAPEDPSGAALPAPLATVPVDPGSDDLGTDADAALTRVAQAALREGGRVTVVGTGASRDVAVRRARAVADRLMRLGTPRGMVFVRGAGAGDEVRVYLIHPAAA
jgi:hypothetical protein